LKVALVRVGIDSGSGGTQGPLFRDGSFEFVPIPEGRSIETRTYGNTFGRYGRRLADYLPRPLQARLENAGMHVDPEFETYTYGDPTSPKAGLRWLRPGDMLVFYAGLQGWGVPSPPALYLVGYFDVLAAGKATDFTEAEIYSLFAQNMHVRHREVFEEQRTRLVLVRGASSSRLLNMAHPLSEMGQDRSGKPLKVLSEPMRAIFGDFDGRVSIQRSPTRWVAPDYVSKAAEFVRGLD
jgi:hypothetical protein